MGPLDSFCPTPWFKIAGLDICSLKIAVEWWQGGLSEGAAGNVGRNIGAVPRTAKESIFSPALSEVRAGRAFAPGPEAGMDEGVLRPFRTPSRRPFCGGEEAWFGGVAE